MANETRLIQELSELQPGDHIRVKGDSGFFANLKDGSSKKKGDANYTHHLMVVYVIDEKRIKVIHNNSGTNVTEETINDCNPEDITVLDYERKYTGQKAVERARFIGKTAIYNLTTYNCEHFVMEATTGEKISNQVVSTVAGGLVGAVIGGVVGFSVGGPIGGIVGALGIGALGTAAGLKSANRKKD